MGLSGLKPCKRLVKDCVSFDREVLLFALFDRKVFLFVLEFGGCWYVSCLSTRFLSSQGFTQILVRDIIERATHSALRSSFWIWVKKMDEDWDHVESRKEDIGTRKNGDNPNNQPNAVCTKFSSNSL